MGLSFASKYTKFLSLVLANFFSLSSPLLLCNNKAAVHISLDCATRKEHRHVKQEFHIIKKLLFKKKVRLEWISTMDQLANIFTKALGWRLVSKFLDQTGLRLLSQALESNGGEVCAGCNDHTPPAIVHLNPEVTKTNG